MVKNILISVLTSLLTVGIAAAFMFPSQTIDKWFEPSISVNNMNPADNPNEVVISSDQSEENLPTNSESETNSNQKSDSIDASILSDDVPYSFESNYN